MNEDSPHARLDRLEEGQMYADHRAEQLASQMATLERALAAMERRLRAMEERVGEIQRSGGNAEDEG